MRVKLVRFSMTVAVALALVIEVSAFYPLTQETPSQPNANQNSNRGRRRGRTRTPPATPATEATPETTPPAVTPPATTPRGRGRRRGGRARMMRGVPSGVQNCIDHLITMAEQGLPYEGHPEEIVNNGLLWNDPKSKCSIGADSALRQKVLAMAIEWRKKNMEAVRTALQEIKTAAPQS